jgi:hypothetical protein
MLCSQTDVEMRLQINFGTDPDPVCAALIAAAQGHIEREVGRPVEADDYIELFDGPLGAYLWLANTPVNTIAGIEVDGVALTLPGDIYFTAAGKVGRLNDSGYLTTWGTYKPNIVEVTYNGGYATVPLDLRDICARAAARAFQAGAAFAAAPVSAGAVKSVALEGSDTVVWADSVVDVTALVSLTADEIEACRYYRNPPIA